MHGGDFNSTYIIIRSSLKMHANNEKWEYLFLHAHSHMAHYRNIQQVKVVDLTS